jgi:hypothetical protein
VSAQLISFSANSGSMKNTFKRDSSVICFLFASFDPFYEGDLRYYLYLYVFGFDENSPAQFYASWRTWRIGQDSYGLLQLFAYTSTPNMFI